MTEYSSNPEIAVLQKELEYISSNGDEVKKMIAALTKSIDDNLVTKKEFAPFKVLVFSIIAIISSSILGIIIMRVMTIASTSSAIGGVIK